MKPQPHEQRRMTGLRLPPELLDQLEEWCNTVGHKF